MKIFIEKLEFYTIIGLLEKERVDEQKVILNLEIEYDYKKDRFIDYAKVAQFSKNLIKKNRFFLIEEALETLCNNLKILYPNITYIKASLKKPDILKECIVGVSLEKKY